MRSVVYPAILATSWEEYKSKIESAAMFAEGVQIDLMDGAFVPARTFQEMDKVNSLKPGALFFEIQLMVTDPLQHIKAWENVANGYILHIETAPDPLPIIKAVRDMRKEIGLAISPETDLDTILPYIDRIDEVLVMTVNPGKGAQAYIKAMNEKIKKLRLKFPYLPIEVDGGVNSDTITAAKKAGANIFVAGSAIWQADDPKEAFLTLQKAVH